MNIIKLWYIFLSSGLSGSADDLANRVEVFSSNVIPPKPPKTFLQVRKFYIPPLTTPKFRTIIN